MTGTIRLDLSDPLLQQKLATLPEKAVQWAEEVLLDQARLMADLAKVYVRVDTGALRDSIRVERGGRSLHWRQVSVRAGGYVTNPKTGRRVNYAAAVEAKYPFMRPAFEDVKPTIAGMIENRVVEQASE